MNIEDAAEEYFQHHGVKGMKWGVRSRRVSGETRLEGVAKTPGDSRDDRISRKARKNDKKWQKNVYTLNSAIEVHNRVADKMNNGGLDKLNNQPRFKGKRMISEEGHMMDTPIAKAYFREYERMNEKFTREAVQEIHGSSPSGGYKATLDTSTGNWSIKIVPNEVQHAADDFPTFEIELEHDENGLITFMRMVQGEMEQSAIELAAEEYFQHFGVPGMKWGVRKKRAERLSEDAKRHGAAKRKGAKALSDKELKDVINRMNMEQQYNRMNKGSVKKGHDAAKAIVGVMGMVTAVTAFAASPAGKAIGRALTKSTSIPVGSIGRTRGTSSIVSTKSSGLSGIGKMLNSLPPGAQFFD